MRVLSSKIKRVIHRIVLSITLIFTLFIGWIIYMANTGQDTLFFVWARRVPNGDKLSHIILFGTLALLFNLCSRYRVVELRGVMIYRGSLLVLLFTTCEEFSQFLLPNRTFDLLDYSASVFGVALFTLLTRYSEHRLKSLQRVAA